MFGSRARLSAAAATLASAAVLGTAGLAAQAGTSSTQIIGPDGVGDVALDAEHSQLKQDGLVGKLRPGCELAEGTRQAKLKAPLEGSVNFTVDDPARAESILIIGGDAATEEGVTIGSRRRKVKKAYPNAKFNKTTQDVFGITLVTIPKRDGGRFQLAIDDFKRVSLIGIPIIPFCE